MSDTPTARPELSPLITMSESELSFVRDGLEADEHTLLRELDAQRAALAAAQRELASIDAALARRPAMDEPTRWENIEKAIGFAARTDEAERRYEAQCRAVASLRVDFAAERKRGDDLLQAVEFTVAKRDEALAAKDRELADTRERLERTQAEREALREGLENIVEAYVAYRAVGVLPAPERYQILVGMIQAGGRLVAASVAPDRREGT